MITHRPLPANVYTPRLTSLNSLLACLNRYLLGRDYTLAPDGKLKSLRPQFFTDSCRRNAVQMPQDTTKFTQKHASCVGRLGVKSNTGRMSHRLYLPNVTKIQPTASAPSMRSWRISLWMKIAHQTIKELYSTPILLLWGTLCKTVHLWILSYYSNFLKAVNLKCWKV